MSYLLIHSLESTKAGSWTPSHESFDLCSSWVSFNSIYMIADASTDHQSHLTLGGGGRGWERGCECCPFWTSLHRLCSYMSASDGKRTRAACVTCKLPVNHWCRPRMLINRISCMCAVTCSCWYFIFDQGACNVVFLVLTEQHPKGWVLSICWRGIECGV